MQVAALPLAVSLHQRHAALNMQVAALPLAVSLHQRHAALNMQVTALPLAVALHQTFLLHRAAIPLPCHSSRSDLPAPLSI